MQTTYRLSYDDGVISGSRNPGWTYEYPVDSGDWIPLGSPFGPLAGVDFPAGDDPEEVEIVRGRLAAAIRRVIPDAHLVLVGTGWEVEL
jgi:hypothetical protein